MPSPNGFLTNLMHYCRREKIDFEKVLKSAYFHATHERKGLV
jgi:hypothetical protein